MFTNLEPANRQEMVTAFENLYDEAFDVTLPSLLWGIHRDPKRKFIAFSEFNHLAMSCMKILHIADTFHYKTLINNKLKESKILQLEHLTADYVSAILDELEKETPTDS